MSKYNNLYTTDERKQLIASQLVILRSTHGYTQKEVAEKIDVKLGTYNAYEKFRSEPPAEVLVRLAHLYDVSIDEIVQKDCMLKDPKEMEKLMNEYQGALAELQQAMADGKVDQKIVADEFMKLSSQIGNVFYEVMKSQRSNEEETDDN